MLALIAAIGLNFVLLRVVLMRLRRRHDLPKRGAGLRFADIILRFSLPSVLISLLTGAATWFGTYLLSRQPAGFESLALVNTGLQWRSPILLVATSAGSVAIPTFSRYAAHANNTASSNLRRTLLWLNGFCASGISAVLILLSTPLLTMYGADFLKGRLVFCMLVVSTVPQVLVNVYMQSFVGRGLLWQALLLHSPALAISLLGYVILVPRFTAYGFAVTTLASAVSFWLFLVGVVRRDYGGLRCR
jgi:O-antigen/teichoic acid export membrane protein